MTADPPNTLDGAVAVVTGATRGIGRAVASSLAAAGAHVVVVGRSSETSGNQPLPGTVEAIASSLIKAGFEALPVQADLTDPAQTERIVEETLAWKGRCDILVNNAAYTSNGPIMTVPWRRWASAFRVQVGAPLQLCQGLVAGMVERSCGRVVNVSSGASRRLTPGLALYSASKLAMEQWSDYMALELTDSGVAVNTLRVDMIVATEGFRHVLETQGEEFATGGQGLKAVISSETAGSHILWMLRQPTTWAGNTVGFADITAAGGPPVTTIEESPT